MRPTGILVRCCIFVHYISHGILFLPWTHSFFYISSLCNQFLTNIAFLVLSQMHASRENPLHNQVPPNTRSGSPEADDQLPKETNTLRSHHFRGNSNEQWNISSSPVASPSSTWPAHHKHSNGMTWVQMHVDGMNSSRPQDLTSFGAKDEIPLSSGGRIFQSASFL